MRLPLSMRRPLTAFLSATLLLPFYPLQVEADPGPRIVIDIGQPSVWSLGQAHYLLAKMHRRNRKLSTKFPTDDDLDSNKITASRIEALRSSLGIEAQFDQAMGTMNSLALKRVRENEAARTEARTSSRAKQAELAQANSELAELTEQIAVLEEENRQSQEERESKTPVPPPTPEENQRKKDLVLLKVKKTRKEEQRNELKAEITALNTKADTTPAAPTLTEPALTTGTGSLPTSATFNAFMEKALREAGKPDLSASMKLDNFVGMQYEIIAKQLTLLRDEVGPDDRVIFFELPASIYTVDKKANDYMAQVEWQISSYCDKEPPPEIQAEVIKETLINEGKTDEETENIMLRMDKVRNVIIYRRAVRSFESNAETQGELAELTRQLSNDATLTSDQRKQRFDAEQQQRFERFFRKETREVERDFGSSAPYPITLEMIKRYRNAPNNAGQCTAGSTEQVRAIDIIPRQSALNVNEYHATVKQTAILAAFKFLVGFAGSVSYQRQRELYEQFVQQQVFASGYGKGDNTFGWTYGPQPGTRRIAPGEKTTFAVLVVPRNTLAVEVKARSRFYKRDVSPRDTDSSDVSRSNDATFLLSVPGKRTQEFWVDGISYAPVRKGKRVTAIIEGKYFSPQLGVMVNGVPLEPVISVSRTAGADEEPDVQSADGVAGEYEITNSRQIILSFGMGDSYVGTPTITFTSPEKTTSINFFDLNINYDQTYSSLQERSLREPMFIEDFNEKVEIEVVKEVPVVDPSNVALDINGNALVAGGTQGKFNLVRLKGAGMRRGAVVSVNNIPIPFEPDLNSLEDVLQYVNRKPTPTDSFVAQESTKSYLVYFPAPKDKWKVAYRQLTRQGYEEGSASKDFSSPTFGVTVHNYRFLPGTRRAEVDLNVLSKEHNLTRVVLEDPAGGRCLPPKLFDPDAHVFRVKCLVPADNNGKLERSSILIKALLDLGGGTKEVFADVALPVRPVLFSLFNPRTGRSEGFAAEEPTVVISGANLQGVTSVLFGSQKAEVSGASPDSITVKAPKINNVPKGEAVAVPVILQTAAGQTPSGVIYTYKGEPLPPNIIVWPRSPRDREK